VTRHEPGEEYAGAATLTCGEESWQVDVTLRGAFQPIDGRFHWYGRVSAATPTSARSGSPVRLRTSVGEADGRLSDPDPWGRLRITGTGHPPF
jgi:hypothetical protein